MKTVVVNADKIVRKWFVVDATDKVLGRLASEVATLLSGKRKPAFSPNQDHGDYVVIVNADKVAVTGTKAEDKTYFRHTGYPGNQKIRTFNVQMDLNSTRVVEHAVKGMLPKGPLGRSVLKKLHVYSGADHPHAAQQPESISF